MVVILSIIFHITIPLSITSNTYHLCSFLIYIVYSKPPQWWWGWQKGWWRWGRLWYRPAVLWDHLSDKQQTAAVKLSSDNKHKMSNTIFHQEKLRCCFKHRNFWLWGRQHGLNQMKRTHRWCDRMKAEILDQLQTLMHCLCAEETPVVEEVFRVFKEGKWQWW